MVVGRHLGSALVALVQPFVVSVIMSPAVWALPLTFVHFIPFAPWLTSAVDTLPDYHTGKVPHNYLA